MDLKSIAILIIFLVFILPGLIHIISFSFSSLSASPEEIAEEGAEIIAEQAVPWWVGVMEWFAQLPNQIASVLLLGFVFFLIWIGVLK